MGSGMFFPICALPFIILVLVLFFAKGHIKHLETRIYTVLLASNFIGLVIELLCTYASHIYGTHPIISEFIYKSYLLYLVAWISTFAYYIFCVAKNENQYNTNRYKLFAVYYLVVIILLAVLPIEVVIKDNFRIRYTTGPAVMLTYAITGIAMMVIIFTLIKRYKDFSNKKYIPVYIFIVLGTVATLIQYYRPEILMVTYVETLISVIMYFTIENPDVKMIQQLEVAREQADKANRAKTEFLSSMSHEIRTPLNAIVGFSGEILEAKDLNEAQENANDIVNASETLLEIVNGILDISKIEAGKIEIVSSPYNAHETFDELAKLITPKMKEKGLDFSYNIAPDLPGTLYGDHANLKKIITNLLSNACKYTEKGYVRYEVNCINADNVCKLIISVEDSGRGIKKENVDQLFTQFQRLEEDRNTTIEGTGLGLAITKQLTELMGGRIILHTVYGEGSKFTVVLNQRIETVQVQEKKKAKTTLELKDVRILIVDDTPLNLKVATKLLERYGANKITTCDSGFECLDKIKAGEEFDFILLDDRMPKLSGTDTLKQLKTLAGFKTPTVALTANAISGMREKYLADGFDDYLAKPIEKEQLIQVINQILGRSITEEINPEEVKQREEKSEVEVVSTEGEEESNTEENKNSNIIPVEENIEEMLGNKLDRTYSEEEAKMNNTETQNNAENAASMVANEETNTLEQVEEIKAVSPEEVTPIEDPFVEEEKETTVTEGVYDRSYLESKGVDVAHGLELLGDMEMYNMTMGDFVSEVETKWADICKYKEENNMPEYAILVHSLKSDCKYLGYMTLADIAYQHELKSKENDSTFVNEHFTELETEYNKVLEIAKEYVNNQ